MKKRWLSIVVLFLVCPAIIYFSLISFDDFRTIGSCHPRSIQRGSFLLGTTVAILFPVLIGYLSWKLDEVFLVTFFVFASVLSGYTFFRSAKMVSGGGGIHVESRTRALVPYLSLKAEPLAKSIVDFRKQTGRFPDHVSETGAAIPELEVCGLWKNFSYQKEGPEDFVLYVEYGESEAKNLSDSGSGSDGFAWYFSKQKKNPGVCCYGSPSLCYEYYCQFR